MKEFFDKMRDLLGDEFEDFLKIFDEPAFRGIRINTLKCEKDKVLSVLPFKTKKTPFCEDGYYIDESAQHIGTHPLHHAGAIYVQEPSAMSAVTMLDVKKGDKVLDLCAAPGSKSTQIASALQGEGVLWCNEIVRSRANILLQNIERCGVKNAVVSSTSPDVLCPNLVGFFDKILVDAPCSGEGMFRKDKDARLHWTPEHSLSCGARQLMILNSAKSALKAGGELMYSTCTYSKEENEDVITQFLRDNPEFELIDSKQTFGRNTMQYAKRICPLDGGEGHFAAKLRKNYTPDDECPISKDSKKNKKTIVKSPFAVADKSAYDFVAQLFDEKEYTNLYTIGDKVYALTDELKDLLSYNLDYKKLCVLKMGVEVLLSKGKRYEPLHNAYTACNFSSAKSVLDLDISDERLYKFLHGEEISVDGEKKGYTLVCILGVPLGFGKASGGMLKNKYPKGLRNNNG